MAVTIREFFELVASAPLPEVQAALELDPCLVNSSLAPLNEGDDWDIINPLHAAAKKGRLDVVRLLVEKGAEVYSNPRSTYPAVMVADWAGHKDVVDFFLKEIPEKAAGTNGLGVACNLAGRQGWEEIVREHVRRDPLVVHERGWIGDTPLHWPSHNGYIVIVRLLLQAGADPNVEENNWIGGTPLHWASERHGDIIRLLVAAGAEVNARVTRPGSHHLGGTPLIWCSRQHDDSASAAAVLLELGADPNAVDAFGKTATDYAAERPGKRILGVLESVS